MQPKFATPPPGETWPHTWVTTDEAVICLTLPGRVPDAVWTEYVRDVETFDVKVLVGLSIGSVSVSRTQRNLVAKAINAKEIPVVTVMDSRIARGMVTTLGWVGLNIHGFSWEQFDEAMVHAKLDLDGTGKLIRELFERSKINPSFDALTHPEP